MCVCMTSECVCVCVCLCFWVTVYRCVREIGRHKMAKREKLFVSEIPWLLKTEFLKEPVALLYV